MNLAVHVETLREHMLAAAEMGGVEATAMVERLSAGLEAATRLVLFDAVTAAADEITREMAPGAVEVRLRGTDPEFVVIPAPDDASGPAAGPPDVLPDGDEDGGTSRLNLRLPESLKQRIEDAARREGLSLNAWLVRTAAAALDAPPGGPVRPATGGERYTGWVR